MEKPRVLIAHERSVIGQAIGRVLAAQGLRVQVLADGHGVADALKADAWDALILDVALPGAPLHEVVELARAGLAIPVKAVILVASVFRRSSYRRQPQRLYGADDYVEIHDLGARLPAKLWRLLAPGSAELPGMIEAEALLADAQDEHADEASEQAHASRLAALLVADLVLHSGERLASADTLDEVRVALGAALDGARATLREVLGAIPADPFDAGSLDVDPIDAALTALLRPPGEAAGDAWS
jgi:DNA-binding response OmpR family regulator